MPNQMTRIVTFLFVLFLCGRVPAEELTFGRFIMSWPDGFSHVEGTSPAIYRGPAGERVRIVTVPTRRNRSAEEAHGEVRKIVGQTTREFRDIEREFGRPLWPLRTTVSSVGDVHISSAMQSDSNNVPGYVLNYAVVSPQSDFSLIMVAGDGDAFEAFGRFKAALASARWR